MLSPKPKKKNGSSTVLAVLESRSATRAARALLTGQANPTSSAPISWCTPTIVVSVDVAAIPTASSTIVVASPSPPAPRRGSTAPAGSR